MGHHTGAETEVQGREGSLVSAHEMLGLKRAEGRQVRPRKLKVTGYDSPPLKYTPGTK